MQPRRERTAVEKIATKLEGVYLIEPKVFGDQRGYFMETWSTRNFAELGLHYDFVQDNQSYSAHKGTLRGIHFQNSPASQAKLVRVNRGAVMDVAVDLRKGSPTYLQWIAAELSAENRRMLMIPRGFGHGFKTLTDDVEFIYKLENLSDKACDRGIRFDDPAIGIDWGEIREELLSPKDLNAPLLADSDCNFVYGEV